MRIIVELLTEDTHPRIFSFFNPNFGKLDVNYRKYFSLDQYFLAELNAMTKYNRLHPLLFPLCMLSVVLYSQAIHIFLPFFTPVIK